MAAGKAQARVVTVAPVPPITAAAYVRMSTEHQKYSIASQLKTIGEFAQRRGMEICRIYEDAGKSGLNFEGRAGLRQLIDDVQTGLAQFSHLLIYDVSRWGRFQDADESAYYEFICRRHGVSVTYCAEPFENDGSPLSVILKNIKRAMAGEYSRELSVKIFAAQSQIAKSGQTPGGRCPYGLSRVAVDLDGKRRKVVKRGHRREIKSDLLVHAPGPERETRVVREIYHLYGDMGWSGRRIADHLNAQGCASPRGGKWREQTILYLLRNDKYIGTQSYNRTSCKLLGNRTKNHESLWIEKRDAFDPVVSLALFRRVQRKLAKPWRKFTDAELLSKLRRYLERRSKLKVRAMRASLGLASPQAYLRRFGSVRRACELAGYPAPDNFLAYDKGRRHRSTRALVLGELKEQLIRQSLTLSFDVGARHFKVGDNRGYCDAVGPIKLRNCETRWRFVFPDQETTDVYLTIRLDRDEKPMDFFVIPRRALKAATCTTSLEESTYQRYRYLDIKRIGAALLRLNRRDR